MKNPFPKDLRIVAIHMTYSKGIYWDLRIVLGLWGGFIFYGAA
jgi:hypothetical protein